MYNSKSDGRLQTASTFREMPKGSLAATHSNSNSTRPNTSQQVTDRNNKPVKRKLNKEEVQDKQRVSNV